MAMVVTVKAFRNWLLTGLPLTLLAPLLALMLQMPSSGLVVLVLSLELFFVVSSDLFVGCCF